MQLLDEICGSLFRFVVSCTWYLSRVDFQRDNHFEPSPSIHLGGEIPYGFSSLEQQRRRIFHAELSRELHTPHTKPFFALQQPAAGRRGQT